MIKFKVVLVLIFGLLFSMHDSLSQQAIFKNVSVGIDEGSAKILISFDVETNQEIEKIDIELRTLSGRVLNVDLTYSLSGDLTDLNTGKGYKIFWDAIRDNEEVNEEVVVLFSPVFKPSSLPNDSAKEPISVIDEIKPEKQESFVFKEKAMVSMLPLPSKSLAFVGAGAGILGTGIGYYLWNDFEKSRATLEGLSNQVDPNNDNVINSESLKSEWDIAYADTQSKKKSSLQYTMFGVAGVGVAILGGYFIKKASVEKENKARVEQNEKNKRYNASKGKLSFIPRYNGAGLVFNF